jgi:hypothetical protein
MRQSHLSRPPRSVRRSAVHLDNVALVPASHLPFQEHWQRVANDLPRGGVLILLPDRAKQQRVVEAVISDRQARARDRRILPCRQPLDGTLCSPSH